MKAKKIALAIMAYTGVIGGLCAEGNMSSKYVIEESLDIAGVTSDFRVGFCLLTAGVHQYAAYYDKERRMTLAARTLDSKQWTYQILPSKVGWDSHNYITMAVDGDGYLHVSGNMHAEKLIYFRTDKPWDITTLKRHEMTGKQEDRATYPKFLTDHQGQLIFNYRDGGSGRGMRIYNKYDLTTRTWSRFLNTPLLYGEDLRNAYPLGPVLGPDDWYHMVWVWRDTPDCATNNHLSYARSKDLHRWESVFGEEIQLPIVLGEKRLWVDPIPSGGGIINGGAKLTFDSDGSPIINYHKADANGNMQIFAARPEKGKWTRHPLTEWDKPVKFAGNGTMGDIGIQISGLTQVEPGILTMTYHHRDYGSGRLVVDEKTLRPVKKQIKVIQELPQQLHRVESDFEGMEVRQAHDLGDSGNDAGRYMLQWESLGSNHDRPRTPPLPEPSMLRLYKLSAKR